MPRKAANKTAKLDAPKGARFFRYIGDRNQPPYEIGLFSRYLMEINKTVVALTDPRLIEKAENMHTLEEVEADDYTEATAPEILLSDQEKIQKSHATHAKRTRAKAAPQKDEPVVAESEVESEFEDADD